MNYIMSKMFLISLIMVQTMHAADAGESKKKELPLDRSSVEVGSACLGELDLMEAFSSRNQTGAPAQKELAAVRAQLAAQSESSAHPVDTTGSNCAAAMSAAFRISAAQGPK